MERRLFKRIALGEKAEVILHGKRIRGIIEDLSEAGANIITDPVEDLSGFVQGAEAELTFRPLDLETIVLNCRVQWFHTAYPNAQMYKIGMELLNPPWDECRCFV